ncbi:MAG: riboflavin biosynthesis protein RibF [Bdellovibrionales bacterium]|nr:riboflavin biosynthesis protein RibF [Bdellovibrionales bacterium]
MGNFDGVHTGHRSVLSGVRERSVALRAVSVVVSFYPHPAAVIYPDREIALLTSLRRKLAILRELGIDYLYLIHFNSAVRELAPDEFLDRVLSERLQCSSLVIGPDLCIGKGRAGTPAVLEQLAKERSWDFHCFAPIKGKSEEKVSSRLIRPLLSDGKIEEANTLLGAPYTIVGRVVHGTKIGRSIGSPTANLHIKDLLPIPHGVYAVTATIGDRSHSGVMNYGIRPTFSSGKKGEPRPQPEVHFLDGKTKECYGEICSIAVYGFIRREIHFDSVELLKEQIQLDIVEAKEILLSRASDGQER